MWWKRCGYHLCHTHFWRSWWLAITYSKFVSYLYLKYAQLNYFFFFLMIFFFEKVLTVNCRIECQVYIAHGKLQLTLPLDKVKEISQLSLMVQFSTFHCPQVFAIDIHSTIDIMVLISFLFRLFRNCNNLL